MAINPTLKLDWIRAHQTPEQAHKAELTLKHKMLRIQQSLGGSFGHYQGPSSATNAAHAQLLGFTRLLTWASGGNICRASERARLQAQAASELTENTSEPQSNNADAQVAVGPHSAPSAPSNPFASIEYEFVRYMSAGTMSLTTKSEQAGTVELVEYWKVHQYTYPLLDRIAMNVLPAQASSVSSERVFLSSKMTCTSEHSRLSAESMEFLQVLKHLLVHRRRTREVAMLQDDWVFDFVTHESENLEISADADGEYVLVD